MTKVTLTKNQCFRVSPIVKIEPAKRSHTLALYTSVLLYLLPSYEWKELIPSYLFFLFLVKVVQSLRRFHPVYDLSVWPWKKRISHYIQLVKLQLFNSKQGFLFTACLARETNRPVSNYLSISIRFGDFYKIYITILEEVTMIMTIDWTETNLSNKNITVQTSVKILTISFYANLNNNETFFMGRKRNEMFVNVKLGE